MRTIFKSSIAIAILFAACGGGDPEGQSVDAFFSAVQNDDQVGIDRISVAAFDGEVAGWEIVERGEESEGPFHLPDFEAELEQKRRDIRAQRDGNRNFLSDNRDTYDAYIKKYNEDPSAPFQGELAVFHEELQGKQMQLAQLEVDADQLALDIEGLKNAATLSLRTPVEKSFEGVVKVKPLQVNVNDGSADAAYTVVLHRYELVDTAQNRTPSAQWIIAEIHPSS